LFWAKFAALAWAARAVLPTRLIREQAFGESLDPDKLERLGRYEVHLDRKLERTLAMLLRRKGPAAGDDRGLIRFAKSMAEATGHRRAQGDARTHSELPGGRARSVERARATSGDRPREEVPEAHAWA
jgi:hypothetical protein